MAENAIKVIESTEIRGVFHCEHKPVLNGSAEKGQALLCEACSAQLASGARLAGEGYVLRQTAFGGWVKSKAAELPQPPATLGAFAAVPGAETANTESLGAKFLLAHFGHSALCDP